MIHTAILQLVHCNIMVQWGVGDGVRNQVQVPGRFLTRVHLLKKPSYLNKELMVTKAAESQQERNIHLQV